MMSTVVDHDLRDKLHRPTDLWEGACELLAPPCGRWEGGRILLQEFPGRWQPRASPSQQMDGDIKDATETARFKWSESPKRTCGGSLRLRTRDIHVTLGIRNERSSH